MFYRPKIRLLKLLCNSMLYWKDCLLPWYNIELLLMFSLTRIKVFQELLSKMSIDCLASKHKPFVDAASLRLYGLNKWPDIFRNKPRKRCTPHSDRRIFKKKKSQQNSSKIIDIWWSAVFLRVDFYCSVGYSTNYSQHKLKIK